MVKKTHKIELSPNNKQITYFKKCCGASRFVYNWGLNAWKEEYLLRKASGLENQKAITGMRLCVRFNALKKDKFKWIYEVSKCVSNQPFLDLNSAFVRFYTGKSAYPKYKKKNKSKDSFYISGDRVSVVSHKV